MVILLNVLELPSCPDFPSISYDNYMYTLIITTFLCDRQFYFLLACKT